MPEGRAPDALLVARRARVVARCEARGIPTAVAALAAGGAVRAARFLDAARVVYLASLGASWDAPLELVRLDLATRTSRALGRLEHAHQFEQISLDAIGQLAAVGSQAGVELWDVQAGARRGVVGGDPARAYLTANGAIAPDGSVLAVKSSATRIVTSADLSLRHRAARRAPGRPARMAAARPVSSTTPALSPAESLNN